MNRQRNKEVRVQTQTQKPQQQLLQARQQPQQQFFQAPQQPQQQFFQAQQPQQLLQAQQPQQQFFQAQQPQQLLQAQQEFFDPSPEGMMLNNEERFEIKKGMTCKGNCLQHMEQLNFYLAFLSKELSSASMQQTILYCEVFLLNVATYFLDNYGKVKTFSSKDIRDMIDYGDKHYIEYFQFRDAFLKFIEDWKFLNNLMIDCAFEQRSSENNRLKLTYVVKTALCAYGLQKTFENDTKKVARPYDDLSWFGKFLKNFQQKTQQVAWDCQSAKMTDRALSVFKSAASSTGRFVGTTIGNVARPGLKYVARKGLEYAAKFALVRFSPFYGTALLMAYQAKSPLAAFQQMHTLTVKLTRPFDKQLSQKIQRKEFLPEWMRPKTKTKGQQAREAKYISALHDDLRKNQEQQRGGNPQQISHPAPSAPPALTPRQQQQMMSNLLPPYSLQARPFQRRQQQPSTPSYQKRQQKPVPALIPRQKYERKARQQISHPAPSAPPFATSQQMARLLQLPYRQQPPQYQQPPRYQTQQPPPYQQPPAYNQRGRGIIRH